MTAFVIFTIICRSISIGMFAAQFRYTEMWVNVAIATWGMYLLMGGV